MSRIRTQEEFVEAATAVHGGKYAYSKVVYTKSSEKVQIVCPVHGLFEQTPNKHLAGQGCKQCGRERTRLGEKEFVRRARLVHGFRYDYSRVKYQRKDVKVCIVCPVHGEFWQTPHCHVALGQDCPKCAAMSGGMQRAGDNNPMRRPEVQEKARLTCLARYGTKTYAESDIGRERLHVVLSSPDVQARIRDTCTQRYGAPTWAQSDVGHKRLHELMSSEDMQARVRDGYRAVYGVDHFMKTPVGRDIAREYISTPERRLAIRTAFLDKYGTPNAFLIPSVQAMRPEMLARSWATKRRNGTFSTSQPEESLYRILCDTFGVGQVVRQYVDAVRYPFHCDFYIPVLDLFIELNASWTHGRHWFDEYNPLDVMTLREWETRSCGKGSSYYKIAIQTWTERDSLKLKTAISNHLNYLVFWDNDLTDALAWLRSL